MKHYLNFEYQGDLGRTDPMGLILNSSMPEQAGSAQTNME